jgi:four helix bundle protein
MGGFDHERLEVYQRALALVAACDVIRRSFPSGYGSLADQLDRSSVSIALNIAEGAGEFARREKARFYRIARRSATESAAILDVASRLGAATSSDVSAAKALLLDIVSMLVQLAKAMEAAIPER